MQDITGFVVNSIKQGEITLQDAARMLEPHCETNESAKQLFDEVNDILALSKSVNETDPC